MTIDIRPSGHVTVNGGQRVPVWRGRTSQFVTHARTVGTLNGVRYEFTPTFGNVKTGGRPTRRFYVHFISGGESFDFGLDKPLPVGAEVRFVREPKQ
jgi:hypothetical protein